MSNTSTSSACQVIPITKTNIPGGFCMTPHHFSMNSDFTDREIRVWLVLQAHAKGDDSCFPSVETLASICKCCTKVMRRTISSMEKKGLITRQMRDGKPTLYFPVSGDSIDTPGRKLPGSKNYPGQKVPGVGEENSRGPLEKSSHILIQERTKKSSLRSSSSKKNSEKTVAPPIVGDDRPLKVVQKQAAPSKVLIDHWHDEYLAKKGEKPHIVGGRDGKLFNDLLRTYTIDDLKRRLTEYLDDPLSWMDRPDWSLPAFVKRVGKYPPPDIRHPTSNNGAPRYESPRYGPRDPSDPNYGDGSNPYEPWNGKYWESPDEE